MPLFRYIDAPEGLDDATYLYDTNPDPDRFEEVDAPAEPAPDPEPALESMPDPEPEPQPESTQPTEAAEDGDTEEKNA